MSFQGAGGYGNTNDPNQGQVGGNGLGVAPDPLPSGFLNALSTRGYAHEPSLLEELGINFDHILTKTKIVLIPTTSSSSMTQEIINDADLAGPVIFFLTFGLMLLMEGKIHFGYIYGVALFGTVSLHNLSKFMCSNTLTRSNIYFFNIASILGYCFLPLCLLTFIGIFHSLDNTFGYILGCTVCTVEYVVLFWVSEFVTGVEGCKGTNCVPSVDILQCFCIYGHICVGAIDK